jgi:nucleoside-diphosphate-sugar epimerase
VSDDRFYVVFGTGQVGTTLAAHLAGQGNTVRAVSRRHPGVHAGRAGLRQRPGRAARRLHRQPDLRHTCSYVPDNAAGLATLGTGARAIGQVWHLPGPPTGTTRALLGLVAAEVGHPVGIRSLPKLAVRGLGLVNPMLRELARDLVPVR